MMAAATALLSVCLLLGLALEVEGQDNVALLQPTWMYSVYSGSNAASKAVDGVIDPAVDNCAAANCGGTQPFGSYWVVQLKRWTRIIAFCIFGRSNTVDRRDVGDKYWIGPFWDQTLPVTVGAALGPSDPMKTINFTLLATLEYAVYDSPGYLKWFNLTTTASGKYFSIQAPNGVSCLVVAEAQVYGEVNWLMNMTASVMAADLSPYQSYNWMQLTDEEENTCLTILDATALRQVRLIYPSSPTGRFVVTLLANGTIQAQQKGGCSSGTVLRVTRPRQSNGSQAADYICQFNSTLVDGGTKSYHSFVCDCSNCNPGFTVWVSRYDSTGATAVQLCEVLLFKY